MGCAATPDPEIIFRTKVETVTVTEFVSPPAELTEPCPSSAMPEPGVTWGELPGYIVALRLDLGFCNQQLARIRAWAAIQDASQP